VTVSPDLKQVIQARYGARAELMAEPAAAQGCCAGEASCCGDTAGSLNSFSEGLYQLGADDAVPLQAHLATLGCGNPIALSQLHEGETVLDLGSGGGLDVILSARRVGPSGHAYGVDMTDQMLALAWSNAQAAGVGNVTFMKGDIEHIPAPDASVDVVISNCVINLAADKDVVFAEIQRVLRPGGRVAIADVVVTGGLSDLPFAAQLRADQAAWGSCIAGALSDQEYADKLCQAGFTDVEIQVTRRHSSEELFPSGPPGWAQPIPPEQFADAMTRFTSSFVRAVKPSGRPDEDTSAGLASG